MKHHASRKFWVAYDLLPESIQRIANKNFALLRSDPFHPSLHFKRVGRYWSARIGNDYRAAAVRDGDDLVWFWIGTMPSTIGCWVSRPWSSWGCFAA